MTYTSACQSPVVAAPHNGGDSSAPVHLTFHFNPTDQLSSPPQSPPLHPAAASSSSSSSPTSSRLSVHQRQQRLFIRTENLRQPSLVPSASPPLQTPSAATDSSSFLDHPPAAGAQPAPSSPPLSRFERLQSVQSLRQPFRPFTPSSTPLTQPHRRYAASKPFPMLHHLHPHPHLSATPSTVPLPTPAAPLNPSSAFFTLSKLCCPSSVLQSAVSLGATSAELLPRRPREGEVSRSGAYHLDHLCPVVQLKKAARIILGPQQLQSPAVAERGHGED